MLDHMHELGEWKKMLWYTPEGRFIGESRKCQKCPMVETRNVEIELRPSVLQPTTSLYPAIFNKKRELLILRRSLDIKSSPGEWELPGGGVNALNASGASDERIISVEIARIVNERVGITIPIDGDSFHLPFAIYPTILKGGGDWAFMVYIGMITDLPQKGECRWVSLLDLNNLAKKPEGNRLVSGWGKRMHRLCLTAFTRLVEDRNVRFEADKILKEIIKTWG
jgi:hypothetical protein